MARKRAIRRLLHFVASLPTLELMNDRSARRAILHDVLLRARDPGSPRPDPTAVPGLERDLFGAYARDRWVYCGLAALTVSIWWWVGSLGVPGGMIGPGVVILAASVWSWLQIYDGIFRGVLLEKADPALLGEFSAAEVREVVGEANSPFRKELGVREFPSIYIVESKEANALVTNALFLSFVRPMNAVYINSHLLNVLDRDELRGIVAHELAHFHRYMSVFSRHFGLPALLFASIFGWPGVVMSSLHGTDLEWWVPTVMVAVSVLVYQVILAPHAWGTFVRLQSARLHEEELLCDYTAASYFGLVPQINVLLKLSVRQEVYQVALEEIVGILSTTSTAEFDELLAAAEAVLPPRVSDLSRVRGLVREALAPFAGAESIFVGEHEKNKDLEPRRELVREMVRQRRQLSRSKRLRWQSFDQRIRDGRLDEVECTAFLRAMLRHPEALISAVSEGPDTLDTHPETRDRILFLALTLPISEPPRS
ncbi:MAG: M48 family metalloprotease [Planctomycetota bacterium]